jgi:hypothetical protein
MATYRIEPPAHPSSDIQVDAGKAAISYSDDAVGAVAGAGVEAWSSAPAEMSAPG